MEGTKPTRRTEKDLMLEGGGAGVYSTDLRKHWKGQLRNNEWSRDVIPEIMDGKNIADFLDEDIEEKLAELEREEEELLAAELEAAESRMEEGDFLSPEDRETLTYLKQRKAAGINARQSKHQVRTSHVMAECLGVMFYRY